MTDATPSDLLVAINAHHRKMSALIEAGIHRSNDGLPPWVQERIANHRNAIKYIRAELTTEKGES